MTVPSREFVYFGSPDPLEWRQPRLGMRTHGRRAALNNPYGFEYSLRIVSDPYLDGARVVWVRFCREAQWWHVHFNGRDFRAFTNYAPAEVVWMIYGVNE